MGSTSMNATTYERLIDHLALTPSSQAAKNLLVILVQKTAPISCQERAFRALATHPALVQIRNELDQAYGQVSNVQAHYAALADRLGTLKTHVRHSAEDSTIAAQKFTGHAKKRVAQKTLAR